MSLQTVGAIVCLFLAQVAADTGVHFVMERHPDSYFCGHLQCVADFTKSDQNVFTCVEMTIYDITKFNSKLKLASVSAFDPDLYVDTTKSSSVSCTGAISRLQANLTLKLRHDIDCLYGVYKCQLDVVTESGHPEVLTEIVIPENNHNYSRVAEVISHIDELTGLFNIHTTLVSNQTTVINKLESHLVDITSQLMNQTAEIDRLGNHADHQITKLMDQTAEINKLGSQLDILTIKLTDQTAEINKLGSRLDHQTTKLMNQTEEMSKQGSCLDNQTTNQTAEINKLGRQLDILTIKLMDQTAEIKKLGSRLDHQTTKLMNQTDEISKQGSCLDNQTTNQTAEVNKLGSQLDDLTAQLINQTAQLDNMSQRLDLETTKQKQQQLDTIQKLPNQTSDMSQDQDTCIKGQPHRNETKRITLWGNTAALCDTTTDGGGWIIIQRRTDGDVDFFRGWNEYKTGFGNLDTSFWLGNNAIHLLADQGYNELRIDMIYKGKQAYAHYSNFYVATEAMNYRLTVGAFEGTAGDALTIHNNMSFSTFDRVNDKHSNVNCADAYKGAWWYNACHSSNLNGLWGVQESYSGVRWAGLTGKNSVSFLEMKIRRG